MFEAIDQTALGVAVAVFLIAAAVAWGLKRLQVTDSVGFIVLIVLPFLAYGVATGYVQKISLPGGWAAEFREIATDTIEPTRLAEEVQDLSIIEKAGPGALQAERDALEIGKPIAISLRIGRGGYYSERAIAEYIRAFLPFDPNLTVIFLEQESGRFVASSNGNSVLAALELQDYDQRFVRAMEEADLLALRRLIVMTANSASDSTTNAEALRTMVADGVDALVKTDSGGRAVGLVRRDEIISRLMVKLASG
jgi:hypothetical protein